MKKWNTLTSAAMLAVCSSNAQTLPEEPTAQELYSFAKEQPSADLSGDVVQDALHRYQCEQIEGSPEHYRCQVTVAYYLKSGDVFLDKQELLLHWKDGQWERK